MHLLSKNGRSFSRKGLLNRVCTLRYSRAKRTRYDICFVYSGGKYPRTRVYTCTACPTKHTPRSLHGSQSSFRCHDCHQRVQCSTPTVTTVTRCVFGGVYGRGRVRYCCGVLAVRYSMQGGWGVLLLWYFLRFQRRTRAISAVAARHRHSPVTYSVARSSCLRLTIRKSGCLLYTSDAADE